MKQVVSDVVFLAELGSAVAECEGVAETLLQLCCLVHFFFPLCRSFTDFFFLSFKRQHNFLFSLVICHLKHRGVGCCK